MKRFTITGEFEAENIDDALLRLGIHFTHQWLDATPIEGEAFPTPHTFTIEPVSPTERAEASGVV